jgi:hypothetical protein
LAPADSAAESLAKVLVSARHALGMGSDLELVAEGEERTRSCYVALALAAVAQGEEDPEEDRHNAVVVEGTHSDRAAHKQGSSARAVAAEVPAVEDAERIPSRGQDRSRWEEAVQVGFAGAADVARPMAAWAVVAGDGRS